jgi:plastocyanin
MSLVSLGGILFVLACGSAGSGPVNPGGGGGGGGTLVHAARVTAGTALAFTPQTQTIPAGDTIYFTFGPVQHSVQFDNPPAGVPANIGVSNDVTVKRVFPTAGTYDYHCTVHGPSMNGHIVVQ